ncbi:glutathione S-transferase C-terminal domain-containing protein-like isoform X2 [Dysidea avara]|uniref:glutathione S-transferase C-terminal domain-containing protein-like isoform X2 n=1 Tax=Dysidea avara TaxID=196820 RepID=UPI00333021C3
MDVTAVIVKNTVLHESRSLTFVLSSTISFAQRKPDAVLLYIVDYLAHRSEHKVSYEVKQVDYHSDTVPREVRLCLLPCCVEESRLTCVAGLAACARHLVQFAAPELSSLLGFRNVCLKSPSEFSIWTRFCEITFPRAINQFYSSCMGSSEVTLPVELLQLEQTLREQPQVHNRQKIIKQAGQLANSGRTASRYLEGYSMLLSDLLIFATLHHFVKLVQDSEWVFAHLPATSQWYQIMLQDPSVHYAASQQDQQPSSADHKKSAILVLPSIDVPSIKDETPKKSRKVSQRNCLSNLEVVLDKVKDIQTAMTASDHPTSLLWDKLPSAVDPSEGHLPNDRAVRKRQQIENIVHHVRQLAPKNDDVIVDFCAGGGHLGIVIAYNLPQCKIILVENKEESLSLARQRVKLLGLTNVTCLQCNLDYFDAKFNIGVALHACGIATDLVLDSCIRHKAHFVLSPCCYGSILTTDMIHYPKSAVFQAAVSYEEYLQIASGADQTDWNFDMSKGKLDMMIMWKAEVTIVLYCRLFVNFL